MVVSKVDVVVLACLIERPVHGYDLLERMKARGMARWADVGKASVYQALQRLDRQGLIAGRDQGGTTGPDRRVFRITRSGRERLAAGLEERFGSTDPYESDAGLALGFAQVLGPAAARRALAERDRALRDLIETLGHERDGLDADDPGGAAARAMHDRQIALAEAESRWIAGTSWTAGRSRRKPTVG